MGMRRQAVVGMLFNAMILTYAVLRAERADPGELLQVDRESLFLS